MKFSNFTLLFIFTICSSPIISSETTVFDNPKTILFSASPDQIIADAEGWKKHGVEAFFLDFIAREWSDNIWAMDKKPWTIGEEDDFFQKTKQANQICKSLEMQTFLKIAFDHPFDWFNDIQWENVVHNFRQFGHFAKHSNCDGIALDIEYIGEQYNFNWYGYDYTKYSRRELVNKVRERSLAMIQALLDTFPEMIFLTFPEQGPHLGLIIQLTWIEELAKRNAPGGFHYCIEHTYRLKNPKEYFAYLAGIDQIFTNYLSPHAKTYWDDKCSIAPGIWPFGFDYANDHRPGFTPEELREIYSLHIATAKKFHWIYSHNCYDQLLGRNSDLFKSEYPLQQYIEILQSHSFPSNPNWTPFINAINQRDYKNIYNQTGYHYVLLPLGPDDNPRFQTLPTYFEDSFVQELWQIGKIHMDGEYVNFNTLFQPISEWLISKPYSAGTFQDTHNTSFLPETDIKAENWERIQLNPNRVSIDLTEKLGKLEETCAYALCTMHCKDRLTAQLRLGYNDAIKVWLIEQDQPKLIFDYFGESTVYPDKTMLPLEFEPHITYRLLLKITNNKRFWGFTVRLTDHQGKNIPYDIMSIDTTTPQT